MGGGGGVLVWDDGGGERASSDEKSTPEETRDTAREREAVRNSFQSLFVHLVNPQPSRIKQRF